MIFQKTSNKLKTYTKLLSNNTTLFLGEPQRVKRNFLWSDILRLYIILIKIIGNGFSDFFEAVKTAEIDYEENYKAEYEKFKQKKLEKEEKKQLEHLANFEKDFASDKVIGNKSAGLNPEETFKRKGLEIYSTYKNDDDDESEFKQQDSDEKEEESEKLEFESFKNFLNSQNPK